MLDVVPISLGIETAGGVMSPVIRRTDFIPIKQTRIFKPYKTGQTEVLIQVHYLKHKLWSITYGLLYPNYDRPNHPLRLKVFEGESTMTKNNKLLAKFTLATPKNSGHQQIAVTFDMDGNGILTVSAREKIFGTEKKLTILPSKMCLQCMRNNQPTENNALSEAHF